MESGQEVYTPERLFEGFPDGLGLYHVVARFIVHPSPTVWLHHLELRDARQVDDEVRAWPAEAYRNAL